MIINHSFSLIIGSLIELDDGKFTPENPINLLVKTHGFPVKIIPKTNPLEVAGNDN